MNLTASLVVRNELGRYLEPCITHLLEFCDSIVVLDDASDDGTLEWLGDHSDSRMLVVALKQPTFFKHEGRLRQVLLDATWARQPTHVLNVDADEFVTDGAALRARLLAEPNVPVWNLEIEEIWKPGQDTLAVREDGGWRAHPLPCLWRVPDQMDGSWRIMDRQLACRRVPVAVLRQAGKAVDSGVGLLHFGWADERERVGRHARYARHDKGRFHAGPHLASILWDDRKVTLRDRDWPAGEVFDGLRDRFTRVAA